MRTARMLGPRNKPVQQRALLRRDQILQVTAELLETVGQDDLTTILVARQVGISVGTLYHYFPNKYAILYALSERWLEEWTRALKELEAENRESLSLKSFVERSIERLYIVYQHQSGLLPLIQAISGIPELRALDLKHKDLVITTMTRLFKRLEISENQVELARLGRLYLEMTHALLLVVVNKKCAGSDKSLSDLKDLILHLLKNAKSRF